MFKSFSPLYPDTEESYLEELRVEGGLVLVEALVTHRVVEHEGAGQVEALQVGQEDHRAAPSVWARGDAVRGVGQVKLL